MINSANIAAYISFLYREKYQADAPFNIVHSWRHISKDGIQEHLAVLYQNWGITEEEGNNLEQAFLKRNNKRPPASKQDQKWMDSVGIFIIFFYLILVRDGVLCLLKSMQHSFVLDLAFRLHASQNGRSHIS